MIKKLTRDWILYKKNTEMDDETPLDLSYLSESKNVNNFEGDICNLSQILPQQFIPQTKDLETPLDKIQLIAKDKIQMKSLH